MKYSVGSAGRVFVVRFGQGDRIPNAIEELARRESIRAASVILVGGIERGMIVAGPREDTQPPEPILETIEGRHEIVAAGTIFPGENGPSLHMHWAFGRAGEALVGCTRPGVEVFAVAEAIITEIVGTDASRKLDPQTGWHLLEP